LYIIKDLTVNNGKACIEYAVEGEFTVLEAINHIQSLLYHLVSPSRHCRILLEGGDLLGQVFFLCGLLPEPFVKGLGVGSQGMHRQACE